jgi:hypothetical protein
MYSGKIAVPPGGGGIVENNNNKFCFFNKNKHVMKDKIVSRVSLKKIIRLFRRVKS